MSLGATALLPGSRQERRNLYGATALLTPATGIVVIMMVAPLLILLRMSLNTFDPLVLMIEAFSPHNYVRFFSETYYVSVMLNTLLVAVTSTLACLLLALPIAYRLGRWQSRWKNLVMLLMVLPLFISSTVRSVGWMVLFSEVGFLTMVTETLGLGPAVLMHTLPGVVIGIISINMPYMILTLQSVIEGIGPDLEDAAQSLGATPTRTFWKVVWPLALPGTMIASVLSFILSMNAFATPVLVGGPRFHMMAPLLYWEFTTNNNWPFASALAIVLMTTTIVMTVLANRLILGRHARTG